MKSPVAATPLVCRVMRHEREAFGTRSGWHITATPAASVVTGDAGARMVLTRRVGTASKRVVL